MARTRIRSDQGEDIGFVSERELNDFFADVVITGTNEDTNIITTFDDYLPNRGIFVGSDGNVVTTGTNTINIAGFYTEFVSSSGSLQTAIDSVESGDVDDVNSVIGSVIIEGAGAVNVTTNSQTITVSGTDHTLGAAISGEFRFQTSTNTGPFAAGIIRFNQSTYAATTELFFSDTTRAGTDATNYLAALKIGDRVYIQRKDDGDQFVIFDINGAVTDEGNWFRIPAVSAQSGTFLAAQSDCIITLLFGGTPTSINAITGSDGITIVSGSNNIDIQGFYTEFVSSSGTLQGEIDAIVVDQAGIGSITASGVTVTGTVTFDSLEGITLIPNASTNTITFSGTPSTGAAGITDINSETGPSVTLVGAGDVTVSTTASNEITISGVPTLFPEDAPENAIVGAGTVVVTSGSNETIVSGTPHTVNTDTVSDAIIGGVGIVVTSGSNETTIDGHLRYTKDENDAIIGGVGITVTSGSDTVTVDGHLRYDKSENDALIAGHGVVITSGSNNITIDTFDDTDVDSLTASGVTVTGSVQLATLGGISVSADASTDTVTISGGSEVGELIGSLFQIEFTNGGNTSNTWLAVSDSNLSGNRTPWVACFPCRLAGLSFSNRNDGTMLDLEIHVARVGDGNTNNLEFTYQIISARTAFKTNLALDALELNPGDKVSVYAQNTGSQGRDVWFGVFWEITNRTTDEGSEDWTGDIS